MVIIYKKEHLFELTQLIQENNSIVFQINSDINLHAVENTVSLIYVWVNDREFIVPINHQDNIVKLDSIETKKTVWTIDKKRYLHNSVVVSDDVRDLNYSYYMLHNDSFDIDKYLTTTHDFYYRVHYNKKNINDVIPLLKHYEFLNDVKNNIKSYMNPYNETILDVLSKIEYNGLQTINGMVYSEYNPFTSTGRPSNRFGGINFAALNKKDGSRKQFISRFKNGVLVEFDYDAYHPRLIGDLIGYKFPGGSVHQHLADLYGLSYDDGKSLTFKYLYGGITNEILDNPFFKEVNKFVQNLWNQYKSSEFIESYIYNRRIIRKNLQDMNPNKLFNYMIQLLETENNIKILNNLLSEIEFYNSKLILYNYDSFLFDFDYKNDGLEYLKKIKLFLECDGKFPTKITMGNNYHEMEDITEKLNG